MTGSDPGRVAEEVARLSYGRLVAWLASLTRDVAAAEDALSEGFAAALAKWPVEGCPAKPEAWLLTVARRKALDAMRRSRTAEAAGPVLRMLADDRPAVESEVEIPDRRLALLFACAHPSIDPAVRSPLMLQVVLGLDAKRIAAAFLTAPATMGKRLVRAKEKIREAGIPFQVPGREDLPQRLDAVLEAIYAAYSEGWTDPSGADASRRELTGEALFLARLVVELLPEEPEATGLLSLMLHAEARRRSRRTSEGEYVPLAQQDTAVWDWTMIAEAESVLRRAAAMRIQGRYQLEAAIQSAHVFRRATGRANWGEIAGLYEALYAIAGSPVVAINRALAIAEVDGPQAGLAAMPPADGLAEYQPYWAARADLLLRMGAKEDAVHAYGIAIGLERDPAVRRFLLRRQEGAGRP